MLSRSSVTCLLAVVIQLSVLKTAEAGPFLDWLFGGRRTEPAYPIGAPVPLGSGYGAAYSPGSYAAGTAMGYVPGYGLAPGYGGVPGYGASYGPGDTNGAATGYGNYYGMAMPVIGPSGAGYPQAAPSGITAATVPAQLFPGTSQMPQPMSLVPNYDSRALRAPVTYYRPLMTTDPSTGAQVVSMAPCTSYQYLTQRVPTFGQSALYGSYQAPTLAPQLRTIPTYSLPSGGVPLAQSIPPTRLPAATFGYSPYSTYQPGLSAPQIIPGTSSANPGYATAPMSSSPYYASNTGGSSGTIYSTPVPGLVAPQSVPYANTPTYTTPLPPSPTYSTPPASVPSTVQPSSPLPSGSSIVPSYPSNPGIPNQVLPGTDPADTVPSLPPYNGMRPQLRSIVPDASGYGNESASTTKSNRETGSSLESSREFPVMSPIPAPEGLEKPRWNPGLLREGDMTALRPVSRYDHPRWVADHPGVDQNQPALATGDGRKLQVAQLIPAGQSKKIVWTKFNLPGESPNPLGAELRDAGRQELRSELPVQNRSGWRDRESSLPANVPGDDSVRAANPQPSPAPTAPKKYDSSGWKASR